MSPATTDKHAKALAKALCVLMDQVYLVCTDMPEEDTRALNRAWRKAREALREYDPDLIEEPSK